MKSQLGVVLMILYPLISFADGKKTLVDLLNKAYENNSSIQEISQLVEAEKSLIVSQATLDDPMVGVQTFMNSNYATISQNIRFPTKYYIESKVQSSRVESLKSQLREKILGVRQQILSYYYGIYSIQKMIELTKANMKSVREFARVAERKYASGISPQADSMKAHFELTQLEIELIRLEQEEETLQAGMQATLNDDSYNPIQLNSLKLASPKVDREKIAIDLKELNNVLQEKSPSIQVEKHKLKEREGMQSLSRWEFAPDFQLQYQKRVSGDAQDLEMYMASMSIPLWFWKKTSEASSANAKKMAQEHKLSDVVQKQTAKIKDLKSKVMTGEKTLKIYETSLIPQALASYNSSRAAYQANKTSFLDLLDSERSLYRVRTGYYQSLKQHVENLGQLEAQMGLSLSDIAMKIEENHEK